MRECRCAALVGLLFVSTAFGQFTPKNIGLAPEGARECAEQGDADCQAKLGWFYEEGANGVKEDHALAIQWYRKAAEQGLIAAQMVLATTYEGGYHAPQDYAEAAKWYRRAAEQGDLDAQRKLALFYWIGKGVPKDLVRAHMWANLTAAGGQSRYEDNINATKAGTGTPKEKEEAIQILRDSRRDFVKLATEIRDSIERMMTREQIAEAQRLAREWKPTKAP